ncbi:hypothetical protein CR532_01035 [Candidatus Borreliella tachyglossi]|uniref:Uncharacterized protein n=1 Tax=Candidatus Borreliella tachyglossi TaxID=1964448 RepID=A0A2S1LWE3_9SPIR|nr:hypothetical protein [Candidatus Borreliella tachyglossi]AWG42596.1 hypothetical protein CR532_01035 [Candidatus Borreliella tachyglossi]
MHVYKNKRMIKYLMSISLAILVILSILLFFNITTINAPQTLNSRVKKLFLTRIAHKKGKSANDYSIESFYSIFKDTQGNEIAKDDKLFSEKVAKVDALITYYYKADTINTNMHSAFVSYDVKRNEIKFIHSE